MKRVLLFCLVGGFCWANAGEIEETRKCLKLTWKPAYGNLAAMACGNNSHVAVGPCGTILFSRDGRSWRCIDQVTSANLRGIAFGKGLFIAVGSCGTIATSADGLHWSTKNERGYPCFRAIAFGGGTFVATGTDGAVLTSTDAVIWRRQGFGSQTLHDVIYSNGQFIAVGDRGLILRSHDGESWNAINLSAREYLRTISVDGEKLVVQSNAGNGFSSADGAHWHRIR
jgi:photosystem II stability/assembly factor-like uncharacterized protein